MGRGTIHKGSVEGPAGIYGECGTTFFNGTALPHHKFGTQFESKYLYKALAIGIIIIAENFRAREKTFALWNKRRIYRCGPISHRFRHIRARKISQGKLSRMILKQLKTRKFSPSKFSATRYIADRL